MGPTPDETYAGLGRILERRDRFVRIEPSAFPRWWRLTLRGREPFVGPLVVIVPATLSELGLGK